ncbi:hypothetical protein LCGC14_0887540 [marine sediment metagenome]|uniref:AAA+ ATPase domain-containing protein n=1 Tax=marine sediment metagenome TaxID=412755 RepID=A0A0F9RJK7_9ZZZZ
MQVQDKVLAEIEAVLQKITIVNISGESGTGKTSFALYLVSQLLQNEEYCIWINASEPFPKRRLEIMYKNHQRQLKEKLSQFFVAPSKVFPTIDDQSTFLRDLYSNGFPFPPSTRFIVIDNISHHLRFSVSQLNEINKRILLLDNFYNSELLPLILHCSREKIVLILIHEVSFNVKLQKTIPFFHTLYKRMKGLNIFLKQFKPTKKRVMELALGDQMKSYKFKIKGSGFEFW